MKIWHWILLAVAVALLPLGLNWLILQPRWFDVVGDGAVWLSFWVTYISAIASLAMVITALITLKQNKEQVDELKRQWEEQNRPIINILVKYEKVENYINYRLCVENIGNSVAHNIRLTFPKKYINKFISSMGQHSTSAVDDFTKDVNKLKKIPLSLNRGKCITLPFIMFAKFMSSASPEYIFLHNTQIGKICTMLNSTPIDIIIKYESNTRKYKEKQTINFAYKTTTIDNDTK